VQNKDLLENSILLLSRLQGIGSRSARRILFDLMKKKDSLLLPLINTLEQLHENISHCNSCFNLDVQNPCSICANPNRSHETICVVEDISSLWAIEKTKNYDGVYFVLGGNLSAQKHQTPENLHIDKLIKKANEGTVKELILATSATIEGQITNNYIHDNITNPNIKFSILAQGIPVGGEIDYLDEVTLSTALKLRKQI
jgi:recombination protein RecR